MLDRLESLFAIYKQSGCFLFTGSKSYIDKFRSQMITSYIIDSHRGPRMQRDELIFMGNSVKTDPKINLSLIGGRQGSPKYI